VSALSTLRSMVLDSARDGQVGDRLPVDSFRLDADSRQAPTELEAEGQAEVVVKPRARGHGRDPQGGSGRSPCEPQGRDLSGVVATGEDRRKLCSRPCSPSVARPD
jgi:hypothetical protein